MGHGRRGAVASHVPSLLTAQRAANPDIGVRLARAPGSWAGPVGGRGARNRSFSGSGSSAPLSRALLRGCRFITRSQDEIPAADALPRDIVEGRHVGSSVRTCGLWSRWSQPRPRDHEAAMPASSGMEKSVTQAGPAQSAHRAQEARRPVPNRTDDDRQRNVNPCRWSKGPCRGLHVPGGRRILGATTPVPTPP